MLWTEAQSTPVIALFVLIGCYTLMAAIICLAATLSRRPVAKELKAIVPVTLTPLGVLLGLFDRAREYVGQEVGALRETVLLADALPQEVGTSVRDAIRRHLDFIESEEWPAMARRGGASLQQSVAVGLREALTAVLAFVPMQANQRLAQERAVIAIERA